MVEVRGRRLEQKQRLKVLGTAFHASSFGTRRAHEQEGQADDGKKEADIGTAWLYVKLKE